MIYLATKDDKTHLVNITAENARSMMGEGWQIFELGLPLPGLMPGVLARIEDIDRRFAANMDVLKLEPRQ